MARTGPLRVEVLGDIDVGKSSLIVRYLTKKFIGEYRSGTDTLYRWVLKVDGSRIRVEIMDTSARSQAARHLQWAEAFVVVYAITDRYSYIKAADIIKELSKSRPSASVLLLGNKSDLEHLREVKEVEARTLGFTHSARFSELSPAESCLSVVETFDNFLKEVNAQRSGSHIISVIEFLNSLIGRNSPAPLPSAQFVIVEKENKQQNSIRRLCRPSSFLCCSSPRTAV